MEILLYEKRKGFPGGAFFLDSMAPALASHLIHYYTVVHYYSVAVPLIVHVYA
jgi:hypothetical protein